MQRLKLLLSHHWLLVLTAVLCLGIGFLAQKALQEYRLYRILMSDEAALEALAQMIVLPNEIPSMATVTDKEKLGDEPFFQAAENGDKVIIYSASKRAYLFRPREQKIIDMTVIVTGTPATDPLPVFQTDGQ